MMNVRNDCSNLNMNNMNNEENHVNGPHQPPHVDPVCLTMAGSSGNPLLKHPPNVNLTTNPPPGPPNSTPFQPLPVYCVEQATHQTHHVDPVQHAMPGMAPRGPFVVGNPSLKHPPYVNQTTIPPPGPPNFTPFQPLPVNRGEPPTQQSVRVDPMQRTMPGMAHRGPFDAGKLSLHLPPNVKHTNNPPPGPPNFTPFHPLPVNRGEPPTQQSVRVDPMQRTMPGMAHRGPFDAGKLSLNHPPNVKHTNNPPPGQPTLTPFKPLPVNRGEPPTHQTRHVNPVAHRGPFDAGTQLSNHPPNVNHTTNPPTHQTLHDNFDPLFGITMDFGLPQEAEGGDYLTRPRNQSNNNSSYAHPAPNPPPHFPPPPICAVNITPQFDSTNLEQQPNAAHWTEVSNGLPTSDHMKEQCKKTFQSRFVPNVEYESPQALYEMVVEVATQFNFSVSKHARTIKCSRSADSWYNKNQQEKIESGLHKVRRTFSTRVECPFRIMWTYTDVIPLRLREKGETNTLPRYSDKCRITSVCAEHGHECKLSSDELKVTLKRSGYLSRFEAGSVTSVVNMVVNNPNLSSASIKTIMRPLLPPGYHMCPMDVVNFRIWCKHNFHRLAGLGQNVTFNREEIGSTLIRWRKCKSSPSLMEDAAAALAEVLKMKFNHKSLPWQSNDWDVEIFLRLMKKKESEFDYRIVTNDEGESLGVVWQTAFQRECFRRWGDVLFVDAMKRKLNHLHWPYFGPVVIDCNSQIHTVCEAICCAERIDAYYFVLDSMYDMSASVCPRQKTKCIFADKFLDRCNSFSLLSRLGMTDSCHVFWDQFHIVSDNWPKSFGNVYQGELKDEMSSLINSSSQSHFNECLHRVEMILMPHPTYLDTLQSWVADQEFWALHHLRNYGNTLFKKGSSHAEQNHHSVLSFLGNLYEEPINQVKQLIDRNHIQLHSLNSKNTKHRMKIQGSLACKNKKGTNAEELQAATVVGSYAMKHWTREYAASSNYTVEKFGDDAYRVKHKEKIGEGIVIKDAEGCSCTMKRNMLIQCRHELCLDNNKFNRNRFAERWIIPDVLSFHQSRNEILNTNREEPQDEIPSLGANCEEPCSLFCDDAPADVCTNSSTPQNQDHEPMQTAATTVTRPIGYHQLADIANQVVTESVQAGEETVKLVCGLLGMMHNGLRGNKVTAMQSLQDVADKMAAIFSMNKRVEPSPQKDNGVMSQIFTQDSEGEFDGNGTEMLDDATYLRRGTVLPPIAVPQLYRGARKRLKGSVELARNTKKTKRGTVSCTFCRGENHKRNNCPTYTTLGYAVQNLDHSSQLQENLKNLKVPLQYDPDCTLRQDLPGSVRSIIVWGSSLNMTGSTVVHLSLLGYGSTRLAMFPEADEPYPFTLQAITSFIFTSRKNLTTFVANKELLKGSF